MKTLDKINPLDSQRIYVPVPPFGYYIFPMQDNDPTILTSLGIIMKASSDRLSLALFNSSVLAFNGATVAQVMTVNEIFSPAVRWLSDENT